MHPCGLWRGEQGDLININRLMKHDQVLQKNSALNEDISQLKFNLSIHTRGTERSRFSSNSLHMNGKYHIKCYFCELIKTVSTAYCTG